MAEQDDDVALIRRWFQKLQLCIQAVDFVGSRPLFADDIITFGTFAAFTDWARGNRTRAVASRLGPYRPVPLASG